jgi:hypothetical protein
MLATASTAAAGATPGGIRINSINNWRRNRLNNNRKFEKHLQEVQ